MRRSFASRSSMSTCSRPPIHEVARVLEQGGRLRPLLGHPMLQAPGSGWVDDQTSHEHYWRIGAYLRDHVELDEVAPGVSREVRASAPQSVCTRHMGRSGLLIDDMEEPPPPAALLSELRAFPEVSTISSCAARSRPAGGPCSYWSPDQPHPVGGLQAVVRLRARSRCRPRCRSKGPIL